MLFLVGVWNNLWGFYSECLIEINVKLKGDIVLVFLKKYFE